MITTIGCCIVVWVLILIWHWYRRQKLEDDFIKRYDEVEEYWIDLRNTYRDDIKTTCKRIVELDEENTMLRDKAEELRRHMKAFAGFAATCRRENSHEWMVMMLDWLNGVCWRVSAESYFILDGHEFKVVDNFGKEQGA